MGDSLGTAEKKISSVVWSSAAHVPPTRGHRLAMWSLVFRCSGWHSELCLDMRLLTRAVLEANGGRNGFGRASNNVI